MFAGEDAGRRTVRHEVPAQKSRAAGRSLDDHGAGPVTEQDAGAPVGPVDDAAESVAADYQDGLDPTLGELHGRDEAIDEA